MIKNWQGREYGSVSEAVVGEISGSGWDDRGQLESLETTASKVSRVLGNLIQTLVERKLLTEEEVEAMLR